MAFSLFSKNKPDFLSNEEKEQVVQAIRDAESRTSGEIRIYMESHCKYVNPVDRASEIFYNLKMDQTSERNGVLLYIAVKDHQLAIFGDEGIYNKTGKEYWHELVSHVLREFNQEHFAAGICQYVYEIGEGLHAYFPYDRATDHNELPDDIIFGK
ncbi:TPM domain-containing protein [Niabella ginsengisoli]|uniref:TPM domain-containing protein n=1 Tax=Niabella ginsengisoli TaxID=522298 RepID=A0ABS9SGD7_9BACT|nr:TPM domain-containing protein [Niabella ginsengisoli]MCH5597433.1 TPM domain-containing protein [Niabella ginsengisoli]